MTERVLGPTGGRRRKRVALLLPVLALAALILVIGASASVSTDAGFQGDDGNLVKDGVGSDIDWNSFAPVTWTGTAPSRRATDTSGPWTFTGLEDWQITTSDSAFAGGTKQDDDCASVNTGKAPNKDDLKRAYFASATGPDDHVYLALAWVRIPQNTTSSSAHVGFEFNQGDTACGAGSDSLVERTVGDRLVVYNFEGGSSPVVLKLLKWQTTGICEASGKAAPAEGCWVLEVADLTAAGDAVAKVNLNGVADAISPTAPPSENLGSQEFGEALIDMTDAGVFPEGECAAFGHAYAVSRSSGNSAQAQMKDLAGPGDVDIKNCGSIVIRKVTSPSPDPLDPDTSFAFSTTGGLDPATFNLKNGEANDYGAEVLAGSYTVSETPDSKYTLSNISCSASTTTHGSDIDIGADADFDAGDTTITIDLAAQDSIDCTFTNTLNKANPTLSTVPTLIPHDSATLNGAMAGGSADGAADGSVTFELYKDSDDGIDCDAGELVFSYKDASAPFATVNDGTPDPNTKNGYTITSDDTYLWKVIYAGDTFNNGYTLPCGDEKLIIDVFPNPS